MPSGRTTAICEASDGFVLAPLLFLYVNDMCSISNKFKSHRLWLLISLICYLFADDTKMLYSH